VSAKAAMAAASLLALAGCALPLISTEYDPGKAHKYKRTGTNFPATTDLPRDWKETDLKYMDKDASEDLVRRQRALGGGG
jgi:hypothetical protein